jgi:hypothetical protein
MEERGQVKCESRLFCLVVGGGKRGSSEVEERVGKGFGREREESRRGSLDRGL